MREHKQIAATLEAADWFVRFDDDSMLPHDRTHYLAWLKQSPVHVAETLRLMRIYRSLLSAFLPTRDAHEEDAPPGGGGDCEHSGLHRLH